MEKNPRIGTSSGKPYFVDQGTGNLVPEVCGDEMSVGMTKFYRVRCCREIGWIAESVTDEDLKFIHLRPMGSSQKGIWTGRVRSGYGQYFMGTAPMYLLASALFRLPKHPVLIGSVAMVWGYASSAVRGVARYDDPG